MFGEIWRSRRIFGSCGQTTVATGTRRRIMRMVKEMSLIRTVSTCPHPDCIGRSLAWNQARIVDKYSWS